MEYIHGDFKIRVGAASTANSKFKGTTLEVEYVPIALVEYGNITRIKKDQYSPLDTMEQYKGIFTEMRNRTSSSTFNA